VVGIGFNTAAHISAWFGQSILIIELVGETSP